MTYAQFAAYIRHFTHTNATTFTDADMLVLTNAEKDAMAMEILGINENYFGLPYFEDLVSNQREYPIDISVANQIKFIEVKLDGTNWERLEETDFNLEDMITTEEGIQSHYQGRDPEFVFFRNSLWILSDAAISAVTDGLKIWAYTWPADFTNLASTTEMATNPSSTTHGWPRPFQKLLAEKVIVSFKEGKEKPIPLTKSEAMWGQKFQIALDHISRPHLNRSFRAQIPRDTGENY